VCRHLALFLAVSLPLSVFMAVLCCSNFLIFYGGCDRWHKQNTFSSSLAVMSVLGSVLGLGDRHLDNLLMDFSSGSIVHIDYGVCFDNGLALTVRLNLNLDLDLGWQDLK
jgi:hypothetical protein